MQVSLQTESGLGFISVLKETRLLKSRPFQVPRRVPGAAPGLCSHYPVPQKTLWGLELHEEGRARAGLSCCPQLRAQTPGEGP